MFWGILLVVTACAVVAATCTKLVDNDHGLLLRGEVKVAAPGRGEAGEDAAGERRGVRRPAVGGDA